MSSAPRYTELRSGGPADLPAVATVMREAFDPRYGEAWTSAQCMGMLALPGSWLTLAIHDGAMAGFALARSVVGDGELLLLAVHPAVRRRGVGAALLRAIIAEARNRRTDRLHLEVRASNSAVHIYRHHGFEQVGTRPDYYCGAAGETFDAQTFALTISV